MKQFFCTFGAVACLILSSAAHADGFAGRVIQSSAVYMAAKATTGTIESATGKISDSLKKEEVFEGKVVRVLDGDTVDVLHNGVTSRIRFDSIDAPEKSQPFGQTSKKTLTDWIGNQTVSVHVKDKDKHGRLVGVVFLEGVNINRAMVEKGYAFVYKQYLRDDAMTEIEKGARAAGQGVWSIPESQIVKPWDYRKTN